MRKSLILILVLVILLFIQTYQYYLVKQMNLNHFIEAQEIKASFATHHIEGYFENIKKELTLISRLDDVKVMDKAIERTVWKIAINNIEKDWLTEIYITQKDFDGFHEPFMLFELEGEKTDKTIEEYHALERELKEYAIISNWRNIFRRHKNDFLVSREHNLCMDLRGFVASVPIYKDEDFVGQVSGMFSKEQLFKIINRDIYPESTALLIDGEGNFITEESLAAYSNSSSGPFTFNPNPDENIRKLKESTSFRKIWQKMIRGEEGYGSFELTLNDKQDRMFIYYMPVEWNKSRWFLGVITPENKITDISKAKGIRKYQVGFVLIILLVLVIGGITIYRALNQRI